MALITSFPILKTRNNSLLELGTLRESVTSQNAFLDAFAAYLNALQSDYALNTAIPSTGTTNTMATPAQTILIAGVPTAIAAETAKAFGALGTIPASTWGLIAIDRVAAATTTFVSAAANYTTGYATEALAKAAIPAKTANKARTGYITIKASASGWGAGTDGLALGSGGNIATTTNFYADIAGQGLGLTDVNFWANVVRLGNLNGTELIAGVS